MSFGIKNCQQMILRGWLELGPVAQNRAITLMNGRRLITNSLEVKGMLQWSLSEVRPIAAGAGLAAAGPRAGRLPEISGSPASLKFSLYRKNELTQTTWSSFRG